MLQYFTEHYAGIWESSSSNFPRFSRIYSPSEKRSKEQLLDQFLQSIKSMRKDRNRFKSMTTAEERLFFENARGFLHDGLDFSAEQLEMMFSDELIEVSRAFVRQARTFDSELSVTAIFQACRNSWIMHGLQLIMGLRIQLTPSVFAYSMLYPYTDNLIDDPNISNFEKLIFSERFRERLSGVILKPANKTEDAIFRLVELIENEYSRTDFPEVFESLLNIHEAQTNSLKLIQLSNLLSDEETLKICLAKGGSSVLADGFLVAGKLTQAQKYFLFGYGAYLQLLDDIQDVDEDFKVGLMTYFSKDAFKLPLDEKLNKTYWFGEQVMKNLDFFEGKQIELFKSLMRKSMDLFITEAIAQNPDTFSQKYVTEFEIFSPLNFGYICKRKEQFLPYNGFLLTVIGEFAF